jgi:hypothetical protein
VLAHFTLFVQFLAFFASWREKDKMVSRKAAEIAKVKDLET